MLLRTDTNGSSIPMHGPRDQWLHIFSFGKFGGGLTHLVVLKAYACFCPMITPGDALSRAYVSDAGDKTSQSCARQVPTLHSLKPNFALL